MLGAAPARITKNPAAVFYEAVIGSHQDAWRRAVWDNRPEQSHGEDLTRIPSIFLRSAFHRYENH